MVQVRLAATPAALALQDRRAHAGRRL